MKTILFFELTPLRITMSTKGEDSSLNWSMSSIVEIAVGNAVADRPRIAPDK